MGFVRHLIFGNIPVIVSAHTPYLLMSLISMKMYEIRDTKDKSEFHLHACQANTDIANAIYLRFGNLRSFPVLGIRRFAKNTRPDMLTIDRMQTTYVYWGE